MQLPQAPLGTLALLLFEVETLTPARFDNTSLCHLKHFILTRPSAETSVGEIPRRHPSTGAKLRTKSARLQYVPHVRSRKSCGTTWRILVRMGQRTPSTSWNGTKHGAHLERVCNQTDGQIEEPPRREGG